MNKKIILLLLLVVIGAALGVRQWLEWRESQERAAKAAAQPPRPCEARRVGLPDAPAAAGLEPQSLAFSPDCRWLVVGNRNGSLQVFNSDTGKLLAEAPAHTGPIGRQQLVVTGDGRYVFSSAHVDPVVLAWTLPDLQRAGRFDTGHSAGAQALAWNDARKLLFTAGGQIQAWPFDPARGAPPVETAQPLFSAAPAKRVDALAVSHDAAFLASAELEALQLWRIEPSERPGLTEVASLGYAFRDRMTGVSFSADGKLLVSVTRNRKIDVWQLPELKPLPQAAADPPVWEYYADPWKYTVRPPRSYAGADKPHLVIRLHDSTADRVHNAVNGKDYEHYAVRGHMLAMGAAGGISVFDYFASPSPAKIVSVAGSSGRFYTFLGFAALPGTSLIALKRYNDEIALVDVDAMREVRTLKSAAGVAVLQATGDGRHVAYSTADEIALVDASSGRVFRAPRPLWRGDKQLINLTIAASADGRGVAGVFGETLVEVRPDQPVASVAQLPVMQVEMLAPLAAPQGYLVVSRERAEAHGAPGAALSIPISRYHGAGMRLVPSALLLKAEEGELCRYALVDGSPCEKLATAPREGDEFMLDANAEYVVIGGKQKIVRVYKTADAAGTLSLEGHLGRIQFAKLLAGRLVSVDSAGEVRVWALPDGKLIGKGQF